MTISSFVISQAGHSKKYLSVNSLALPRFAVLPDIPKCVASVAETEFDRALGGPSPVHVLCTALDSQCAGKHNPVLASAVQFSLTRVGVLVNRPRIGLCEPEKMCAGNS